MKIAQDHFTRLRDLRAIFVEQGFDLWLVGGCVRDALMDITPKDIDLATSASPDEQVAIYEANDLHFIPTGIQHGTITVVLEGEAYEITSLRTESNHDGRWATMAFTRDLTEDLSRRDLTINAIAMDFDLQFIDPFGGREDLKDKRVRFVGNPADRMREDYLRILRFFRFHARIAGGAAIDKETAKAIRATREGLRGISVERIWSEMSKIVTGPDASVIVSYMRDVGVLKIIGMEELGFIPALSNAAYHGVTEPASVMGWFVIEPEQIDVLAERWKWSTYEWKRARFIADNVRDATVKRWKELIVDGASFEWVADLMRFAKTDPATLVDWEVPVMPVKGRDLIAAGMKPSPQVGQTIERLTRVWKDSDYTATREDLMAEIVENT